MLAAGRGDRHDGIKRLADASFPGGPTVTNEQELDGRQIAD